MLDYSISLMSAQPGVTADKVTKKKVYAHLQADEVMDLDGICEHMASHNSAFSAGTIQGIVKDLVGCIREQLLEGYIIRLGDLGKFSLQAKSNGTASASDFTAQNITALKLNFTPGKKFNGEALRKDATFQLVASREGQATAIAKEKAQNAFVAEDEDDMRSE